MVRDGSDGMMSAARDGRGEQVEPIALDQVLNKPPAALPACRCAAS